MRPRLWFGEVASEAVRRERVFQQRAAKIRGDWVDPGCPVVTRHNEDAVIQSLLFGYFHPSARLVYGSLVNVGGQQIRVGKNMNGLTQAPGVTTVWVSMICFLVQDIFQQIISYVQDGRMDQRSLHDISMHYAPETWGIYAHNIHGETQIPSSWKLPTLAEPIRAACEGDVHALRTFKEAGGVWTNSFVSDKLLPMVSGAAKHGHDLCIKYLHEQCGACIDQPYHDGMTPAHWAAFGGHERCLRYVQSLGADMNAKCHNGWTPAHAAANRGHEGCLIFLRGLHEMGLCNLNASDQKGWTPAHIAAERGHAACLHVLHQAGCNMRMSSHNGFTAAHWSALKGHAKCLQALQNTGCLDRSIMLSTKEVHVSPAQLCFNSKDQGCLNFLRQLGIEEVDGGAQHVVVPSQ